MNKEFFKTKIEEEHKRIRHNFHSQSEELKNNIVYISSRVKALEQSQQAVKEALLKMKDKIKGNCVASYINKDSLLYSLKKIAKEDLGIDLEEKN